MFYIIATTVNIVKKYYNRCEKRIYVKRLASYV